MSILDRPYFVARPSYLPKFIPDSGCILWHPGQDDPQSATLRDRSGYGHNGVIDGAEWGQVPATGLWYLSFVAANTDDVTITDTSVLDVDYITFALWVNETDVTPTVVNDEIISKGDATTWSVRNTGISVYFYIKNTTDTLKNTNFAAATNIFDGVWYFLAGTYDGAFVRLYLNGVAIGTPTAQTGTMKVTADNIYIGSNNGAANWLDGKIALPRVWNSALAATKIAGLYSQERHLFGV